MGVLGMQSRRVALKCLTMGSIFITQAKAETTSDVLSIEDECAHHAQKLAELMARKHGGSWRFDLNHADGFVLLVPNQFDG